MRLLKAVLLVLLILSVVSFGGEAEANDTRNRTYQLPWTMQASMDLYRVLYPWPSGESNFPEAFGIPSYQAQNLGTLTFTVSKDQLVSNNNVIIPDYLPAQADFSKADNIQITNRVDITKDGETYLKEFGFKVIGLTPNTNYTNPLILVSSGVHDYTFGKYLDLTKNRVLGLAGDNFGVSHVFPTYMWIRPSTTNYWTAADDPSITISNVTTNKATISWNTNNTNPAGTSYTLKYQVLKENGDPTKESDWSPSGNPDLWNIIPIDNQNATTALTTTAEIFQPDHTYRLTVQVNHIGGASYNVYSDYVIFSTSSDPAVRAAQEAAIAAQAAKKAAEDTVQYSLDAKTEATGAKNKAQEVYDLVSSLELGNVKEDVSFIKNTMSTPVIQSVKGQNNATATYVNHFVLKIRAAGIQENLRYRVVCDDFDSGWGSSSAVNIHGLTTPGVKTATVMVSNNPDDPDKGSIASAEFTFFKL